MEDRESQGPARPSRGAFARGSRPGSIWWLRESGLSVLVGALVGFGFGAPALWVGPEAAACLFPDDAFYYFQIARNVASGGGFTFDGLHETNGFHPLWLFVLVPVFVLVEDDIAPLRAIALIQSGLAAAAAVVVFRIACTRVGRAAALVAGLAIVALPGAPSVVRNGMESALVLLLIVITWWQWLRLTTSEASPGRGWAALGLACGLAFLARLEAILLVPAILLLERRRFRRDPRAALALLAAPALFVAAYLAWNSLSFGTLLPISAAVKASGMGPLLSTARLAKWVDPPWIVRTVVCRSFGGASLLECPLPALILYAALIALGLILGWRHRSLLAAAVRQSGASFVLLASGLMLLADKLTLPRLESWYEVPVVLSAALLPASLLGRSPRAARLAAAAAVIASVARGPISTWALGDTQSRFAHYRLQAADWIRAYTPPSARIGSWNAGMLGYFSHRAVVNLDGLANNGDYFRRVVRGKDLEGYLRSERIGWLADQSCGPSPRPTIYLRSFFAGHLDAELDLAARYYRSGAADGCPGYAVWRWRHPREGDARPAPTASRQPAVRLRP